MLLTGHVRDILVVNLRRYLTVDGTVGTVSGGPGVTLVGRYTSGNHAGRDEGTEEPGDYVKDIGQTLISAINAIASQHHTTTGMYAPGRARSNVGNWLVR